MQKVAQVLRRIEALATDEDTPSLARITPYLLKIVN